MDGDVAVGGARAHLDGLLARCGAIGGVEIVLNVAEARVEVQPGGDAVADPDVDLAEPRLHDDGATCDLAQADVAVGGLRGRPRPAPGRW